MKLLWLSLHLVCAGAWLGCVLTEALFERTLLDRGTDAMLTLARLHRRVDLMVEIPAFAAVLLTGLFMWPIAPTSSVWLWAKVGFGALAISANLWCVRLVFRRVVVAEAGDWRAFAQIDQAQHRWGAVVLLAILVALGLGVWLLAGGVH